MDKLQYDSFYKFMVSAGVVLVAAPLIGLYYLLCNGNQILISQIEYDALSTTSMQYVQERDQTILWVLRFLPWVLGVLVLCGLACLIYGAIKWHGIQNEIDEQTKLTTKEQKYNVEKLTATEIAAKVIEETAAEQDEQVGNNSQEVFGKARVVKAMEIEKQCFTYVHSHYSGSYSVQQNVRIGDYACDILALSRIDQIDYLFDVKYWPQMPSPYAVQRTISKFKELRTSYETNAQRNCKCILMIVTKNDLKDRMSEYCGRYIASHSAPFDVQVFYEDELK